LTKNNHENVFPEAQSTTADGMKLEHKCLLTPVFRLFKLPFTLPFMLDFKVLFHLPFEEAATPRMIYTSSQAFQQLCSV